MSREMCYRCFWPKTLCWCESIMPMATQTRFVFLMHPKEFKREKAATGRLTHLCLSNSEIQVGVGFDDHPALMPVLNDQANYPVLLYPGRQALNLSEAGVSPAADARLAELKAQVIKRRLVVLILDATWSLGRKMLALSPTLQRLPRIMFTPAAPSRFVIKQQPHAGCLSTLEATHELLGALARTGLDEYPQPDQLLTLFDRMQQFQIRCASDPLRAGYRRTGYRPPAERRPLRGASGSRRARVFEAPAPEPG